MFALLGESGGLCADVTLGGLDIPILIIANYRCWICEVGCSSFELQRSVRKDRSTGVAVNRRNYLDMPILWTREA